MEHDFASELLAALPLLLISFLAISSIVVDALVKNSQEITFRYALFGLMAVGVVAALSIFDERAVIFSGMITTGGYASYFDVLFALGGVLTLLAARPYLRSRNYELDEFYSLMLYAVAGMMLMAHANHLLIVFIGIEIMSIVFYVLSGYLRSSTFSVEAALKYFLLGAFASGFLVYGMALVYGASGTMEYGAIQESLAQGTEFPTLLLIGIGLIIVGLSFKVAAFPFHLWVPDVYQGAPTVVTGFMSTAGKAAAFAAFIPVMDVLMPGQDAITIQTLLAIIAGASMLYGNIAAVAQTKVKRMLAYSSVAHAGYIMMGIVAGSPQGKSAAMFYLASYLFMQLGAFVVIGLLERENNSDSDEVYTGLARRHPVMAAMMAVFMFSLTGIPPLAGFFGKYYLFVATIEAGYTWLTIVGVISSVVSVYFYLGLVVTMYFRETEGADSSVGEAHSLKPGLAGLSLLFTTIGVFLLGILPFLVVKVTDALAGS